MSIVLLSASVALTSTSASMVSTALRFPENAASDIRSVSLLPGP